MSFKKKKPSPPPGKKAAIRAIDPLEEIEAVEGRELPAWMHRVAEDKDKKIKRKKGSPKQSLRPHHK